MTDYHRSDDEQVAALKNWWKANGSSLVTGVALALAAIFGWQAWQKHQAAAKAEASVQFQQLLEAVSQPIAPPAEGQAAAPNNVGFLAEAMLEQADESRYGLYARFALARQAVAEKRPADAEAVLREALQANEDPALRPVIVVRLARVLALLERSDEALTLLDAERNDTFASYFQELKGDLLLAKGDRSGARTAYQAALDAANASGQDPSLVQMKLDDLAGA